MIDFTFQLLLVKKLSKADRHVGICQVGVSFPFNWLAQRQTIVQFETFVDEIDWQSDDKGEEEENEETSEEKVWCQIVPSDPVDLCNWWIVMKPFVCLG